MYFTIYTDPTSGSVCDEAGTSYLYAVNYLTGAGALDGGARKMSIGTGIASSPVISVSSSGTAGLYLTVSGGGGTSASTAKSSVSPGTVANKTNLLFWKDKKLR